MLTDGIALIGSSKATNLTIDNGPSLPVTGNNIGELFYLTTGSTGLYVFGASGWEKIGTGSGGGGGSDIQTTNDLPEGNLNRYWTQTRFNDAFGNKTADDLQDGTVKQFWVQYKFNNAFAAKTTDDLEEGTYNKYFDQPQFNTFFSAKSTDQLTEGATNKYFSEAQFDTFFGQKRTTDLQESGLSQYFTQARARASISAGTRVSYNQSTGVIDVAADPYDVGVSIQGKPSASANVLNFAAVRAFTIPAGANGSVAKSLTAASGAPAFAVKKNGTQIGTVTFNASVTGTWSMTATSFAIGDVLTITAPSTVNATLADISIVIRATPT